MKLAKLDAKEIRPEFESFSLPELVQDVVQDFQLEAEEKGVELRAHLSERLPFVRADIRLIERVLENLIGNGLKFHREGIAPHVRVTGRLADGEQEEVCHLLVRDNGIGFDEKYLDRIFEPFQRLHGRGTYEGTGIGLAICRKIADRHGGNITAESAPGHGATFIVTMPVEQAKEESIG